MVAVEPQRVLGQVVVQVACIGVELCRLASSRFDHPGVAVAHVANIVDQVEVAAAAVVVEVLAVAADYFQRVRIGHAEVAADQAAP